MVESLLDDTKLIKIPKTLAAQIKLVAGRLGRGMSEYATDALTQALRIEEMGSNLEMAVDTFHVVNVHRGAGLVNLPRTSLTRIVSMLQEDEVAMFHEGSLEAGRWYASYISSKLSPDSILSFLQNDLKITWNLDEAEIIEEDVLVYFRATSFNMSKDVTELFVLYTSGIFDELGYSVTDADVLPGLVSFKYIKTLN
ncbi:hypothetical protein HN807_00495 [Candidatus Bathyarchaeota archaeon]|jgi:hypothetical protein|nr:hypothetical protein [Candidatus Bathyarchaeota archaeon]MBT3284635.1 hypothetical protein [Candidatus Bathyarchaeota archaeon]MBT4321029.1 hypothetical protein [Candidatus Bathyarchaeota archaeon]MBT4425091.1 hypothetical protein [Candidatus Bathyarchaeota archaeon]MBT5641904.1 hypothetical protein [Candidatus Bathyarchaeota archaeon]